jgi:SprT-like family
VNSQNVPWSRKPDVQKEKKRPPTAGVKERKPLPPRSLEPPPISLLRPASCRSPQRHWRVGIPPGRAPIGTGHAASDMRGWPGRRAPAVLPTLNSPSQRRYNSCRRFHFSRSTRVTIDDGLALARRLLDQFGLHGWDLRLNRKKRTLGLCRFPVPPRTTGIIELSVHLIEFNGVDEIRAVCLHEASHALAGPLAGHGPHWREIAMRIGARPTRCGEAAMPPGKWRATCPGCKKEYSRHRRPGNRVYWCLPCGRMRGTISFRKVPS